MSTPKIDTATSTYSADVGTKMMHKPGIQVYLALIDYLLANNPCTAILREGGVRVSSKHFKCKNCQIKFTSIQKPRKDQKYQLGLLARKLLKAYREHPIKAYLNAKNYNSLVRITFKGSYIRYTDIRKTTLLLT